MSEDFPFPRPRSGPHRQPVRSNKRMSERGQKWVHDLMADGEARSVNEVLDELWLMVKDARRVGLSPTKRVLHPGTRGVKGHFIPTRNEIQTMFSKDSRYEVSHTEPSKWVGRPPVTHWRQITDFK